MSTALLLLGVLWHEFRDSKNQKIPVLIYTLSCAIALWLIWLLVYSQQSPSFRLIAPFLALAYFHMPWLSRVFGSLFRYQKHPVRFWITVASATYLIGFITFIGGTSSSNFLKILSTGHLAIIPYWGHLMKNMRKKIEGRWPSLAGIVYDAKENLYVAGFFVFLLPVTFFRIFELKVITEQFSIIGLYLLVTGIALKVKESFKPEIISQVISSGLNNEKLPVK